MDLFPLSMLDGYATTTVPAKGGHDRAYPPKRNPAFANQPASRNTAWPAVACGTCDVREQAFTQNGIATAIGIQGHVLHRNPPSLYNVGYRRLLFHDGRETDLQRQIWAPLLAMWVAKK